MTFNGTGSTDPDGDALAYAWDLDGDGAFDDASTAATSRTYTSDASFPVRLQVTDPSGASHTSPVTTITVGNDPPVAVIDAATSPWSVGQTINFSGHATDAEEGALTPSRLSWQVVLMHCPQECHEHPIQTFAGVASGSFAAPDHEYPSHLELRLTARDAQGLTHTTTRRLDPTTVDLEFATNPSGLTLTVGGANEATPFIRRVIVGSTNSLSADSPQTLGDHVRMGRVVGRRSAEPRRHRTGGRCHVHGHLRPDDGPVDFADGRHRARPGDVHDHDAKPGGHRGCERCRRRCPLVETHVLRGKRLLAGLHIRRSKAARSPARSARSRRVGSSRQPSSRPMAKARARLVTSFA